MAFRLKMSGRKYLSPSFNRSCDSSTDSSSTSGTRRGSIELTDKTTFRIMVLGASQTGKTSIVRQFLYDQFSSRHVETMDDMYRGEFEAANGKMINFDIEDVGATYIYEFPSMKSVSLNSADAFILVFSLDKADTWDEVSKLRDIVRDAKDDPDVPIVIVANKSDLTGDPDLPHESLEATAIFDWENGYVESSAKDRKNINKIFKELLNQSKSRFDISIASSPSKSSNRLLNSPLQQKNFKFDQSQDCLKRRLSLPASNKLVSNGGRFQTPRIIEENEIFHQSPKEKFPNSPSGKRRSSLAVLTQDSCKIS